MPEVRKPAFLRNLRLTKVALVGDGANQHARISIFKAKDPEDVKKFKTCPECGRTEIADQADACPDCGYNFARQAAPDQGAGATPATESTRKGENMPENNTPEGGTEPTLEQRVADLEQKLTTATETIKAKDAEIEDLKKAEKPEETEPEDVLKGITDPVVKAEVERLRKEDVAKEERLKAAEEEIRKAREAEADRQETERVSKMVTHLSADPSKLGPALRKIKEMEDKSIAETIEQTLTAANEAVETADLYRSIGKSAPAENSTEGKLEQLAKSYAAEHKVSEAVAFEKVLETDEGKELYQKSLTEGR